MKSANKERVQRVADETAPTSPQSALPDKLYFKQAEVCEMLSVRPYMLNYWEKEFDMARRNRTRARQRLYRRDEVERFLELKHLMFDEKFTSADTKSALREMEKMKLSKKWAHAELEPTQPEPTTTAGEASAAPATKPREDYAEILSDARRD